MSEIVSARKLTILDRLADGLVLAGVLLSVYAIYSYYFR
jgi:hypothetical protein